MTPQTRRTRRILGLDFGLKRIGVAVGNTDTRTAQALSTVTARDGVPDWPQLQKQIQSWLPGLLVVGLPVNMDGSEGAMARRARAFGRKAGGRFGLKVVFVDERLTTRAAEQLLQTTAAGNRQPAAKRARKRDNLAAELIVLAYLTEWAQSAGQRADV
ncbi:MAG: Holliday junction resolvase RuvX [Gammaproteobacteria bacterium]|nr:Holliday junction resolvase RuvX [Gammaproteobacteria bacterium]